jgi:hypothetical protein
MYKYVTKLANGTECGRHIEALEIPNFLFSLERNLKYKIKQMFEKQLIFPLLPR